MADNNLETLKRAVAGIDDVIQTGDNLQEWCQEKIAVAKSMLVTVWDYMLSEKDSEKETFDIGMGQASHGKGVAEAQLDEAPARDVLLGLLDKFYADMKLPPRQGSHSGALDIKSPGTKVWTRGDGTRLRDPGRIQASHWADDKKQAEKAASKFWPWLLKQPGVKSIGQVSGQFGSSPMTDAVSYKGLYFSGGPYGTEFGSMSRVKNPKSVWRHKPFELEPKAEQGVAEDIDHPYDRGLEDGLAGKEYNDSMYSSYEDKESYRRGRIVAKQQAKKGVSEGESAREKWNRASAEREKKHNDAEKEMNARHARGEEDMKGAIDRLEKHVNTKEGLRDPKDNPCWKGYKPVGTKKKGGKTVPNCVPKEGWTHDTLAAQLFETENTYEDRLTNLLNKRLGK
jgi:hypothetical protein